MSTETAAAIRSRLAARPGAFAAALALLAALALWGLIARDTLRAPAHPAAAAPFRRAYPERLAALPAALRSAASAALGAARPAYRLHPAGAVVRGANPEQGLRERFTGAGVQLATGRLTAALALRAYGYGERLRPRADARLSVEDNRIAYLHSGMREWFVNGPLGLEQGFTVTAPPAPADAGQPFTVQLSVSPSTPLTLDPGARSVTLGAPGASRISYGALAAHDASGRPLASRLTLRGHTLTLHVSTAHARLPITIDPIATAEEDAEPLAPPSSARTKGEGFGASVAVSGDSNTALVGAPAAEGAGGAVWVFVRNGGEWVQQGEKLVQPDLAGDPVCPPQKNARSARASRCPTTVT